LVHHDKILSYEHLLELAMLIHEENPISKIRITGGEPLARKGAVGFVSMLAKSFSNIEFCMTTNGSLLARNAKDLKEVGLQRVNISLDTINPDRYTYLTRGGSLSDVMKGIEAARKVGLTPIKINCVLLKGLNDDELHSLIDFALMGDIVIRFLELMSVGEAANHTDTHFFSAHEAVGKISDRFELTPIGYEGTAHLYKVSDGKRETTVGMISPVSETFCEWCDRLRLDAQGRLFSCLLSDDYLDLGGMLKQNLPSSQLRSFVRTAIESKKRHEANIKARNGMMNSIGG